MLIFLIAFVIMLGALLAYFRLAAHYNIIDKPNQRSSHTYITVRGGGIVFPVAVVLWFLFFGFENVYMVVGLMAMAVISFIDDVNTLSGKIRIAIHLLAVSLLFYQLAIFSLPWWLVLAAYIFTIGWINAFNFMDGINGIAVLYALVSLLTFYYLTLTLNLNLNLNLLTLLILASLLFSWFNLRRRARCFAGDVGSVSLAFMLAWFMISLIQTTGRPEYILLFSVYAIDSVFTIIHRLLKRENIFQAHRSHLYQYLSNELKWPHVWVSVTYAVVQAVTNITIILLIQQQIMTLWLGAGILALQSAIYLMLRFGVLRRISIISKA